MFARKATSKIIARPFPHLLLCLFAVLFIWAGTAAAQPDPAAAGAAGVAAAKTDYDSLTQIWSTRTSDLATLVDEAKTLQSLAEDMAAPLADKVADARAQIARLSGLFQASRGHPTEQLALLRQMRSLQDSLNKNIKPLEDIASTIAISLDEVAGLEKDMANLRKEAVADGAVVAAAEVKDREELKAYIQAMTDAKTKLTRTSKRLKQILDPARAATERLGEIVARFETSLDGVWKSYYLTQTSNDLAALATTPAVLAEWTSSLTTRLNFAYPQNAAQWWDAAKSFVISALILTLIGALAWRGAFFLPVYWREACRDIIKGPWLWLSAGMAVLAAATNSSGGLYFAFLLLGSLLVIYAVAAISWRLRMVVRPMLKDKPSPLSRLFPPAVLGVVMLFSDLAARILGLIWVLAMLIFLARIFSINRKHKMRDAARPPLLERIFYGCALWFGALSLLMAIFGYARLGILTYMLLFALVNTITLGNALMYMLSSLVGRRFNRDKQPVLNAVAEAVAIPISWVLSLVCTLPWLWAVPGASQILRQGLSASYTVGEASFDFSKLLFIIILFFLFRSFISLSKTTLKHLPDRLPHLERGVIPPLQTMAAYAFWVVFALVALGMLGVNFTSLAVVAGGLSVGIGFGMQTLFNNLISGLMLIFGRTILIGDFVEVGGVAGTVRSINIRSTTLETPDRALVYVPNSTIMSGQFSNWTRNSRMVRRSVPVSVSHGSDADLVTKLLLQAAEEQEHVLKLPAASVIFNNFSPNSLDFMLYVFIDDLDNGLSALSGIRLNIQRLFTEHGIDIHVPQMAIHFPEAENDKEQPKNDSTVKRPKSKQI